MPLEKYHRLTILQKTTDKDKEGRYLYLLLCDCGNKIKLASNRFKTGNTKSCGCLRQEVSTISVAKVQHLGARAAGIANKTHGMRRTKFYRHWIGMKARCMGVDKNYGGRGIQVCEAWLKFENFRDDMYKAYLSHVKKFGDGRGKTTLERINVNGNYEPKNCKWATSQDQMLNTTKNVYIDFNNQRMTISQWSKKLGGNKNLVSDRLKAGWTIENALSIKVNHGSR